MIVGLTGGIASGKSTVTNFLRSSGYAVIDADEVCRYLSMPDKGIWQVYVERYGKKILLADNELDRKKIGAIIFNDKKELDFINSTLEPVIWREIERRIESFPKAKDNLIFLDVPLLFEDGWDKKVDCSILVYVTPKIQLERLMKRDNLDIAEAELRIKAQLKLDDKVKLADFVIDNSNSKQETQEQIVKVVDEFRRMV